MLLTKEVRVGIGSNRSHYENLGYEIPIHIRRYKESVPTQKLSFYV